MNATASNNSVRAVLNAWQAHAAVLAEWSMNHLVNRTDAWGINKKDGSRATGHGPLDLRRLQSHFRGERLIGVHLISLEDTCKSVKIDIDAHGDDDTAAVVARNMKIALELDHRAHELGLNPILSDSNGNGGYHLEIIFSHPIPSKDAYHFGLWLARDYKPNKRGGIEVFPKRIDRNTAKGFGGGWVRLYGKHHKRDHWTTIYSAEGEWLQGEDAVKALLSHSGDDPARLPCVDYMPTPRAPCKSHGSAENHRSKSDVINAVTRATRYVDRIPGAVSGDHGHDATYHVACVLVEGFDLSVADATPIMRRWNATCDPQWSEDDLLYKLHSADANAEDRGYLLNQEQDQEQDASVDLSGIMNQCDRKIESPAMAVNTETAQNTNGKPHTDPNDEHLIYWEPNIVPMNTVEPRAVQWLWKYRIPNGKLVSLSGNPGLGKSLVLVDIAARVTTGGAWPDACPGGEPGGVVICSAEDDPHDTLRPRLDAAGADVSRINLVQSVVQMDAKTKHRSERLIDLQRDLSAISNALDLTRGCKLLIMDPINAYLGKTDSHKNAEVRQILGPVAEMCHRKQVAFIYLGHLNKSTNGPAMYRTAGSLAFVAAARVAHIVAEDKQDPNVRLFIPVKNNLAPNIGGLSFQVVAENDLPRIAWNNLPVTMTADEALAHDPRQGRGNLAQDKEWLAAELASGPRDSDELTEQGKAAGISRNRLFNAKKAIGAYARKIGIGDTGKWEWYLDTLPK